MEYIEKYYKSAVLMVDSFKEDHPKLGRIWNFMIEVSAQYEYIEDEDRVQWKREMRSDEIKYSYRLLRFESDALARWVHPSQWPELKEEFLEARNMLNYHMDVTLPQIIEKGRQHPAWASMIEESKHYQIPQHFKVDMMFSDCRFLGESVPDKFLWIVYRSGTHMLPYYDDWLQAAMKQRQGDNTAHFYTWDGVQLSEEPHGYALSWAKEKLYVPDGTAK